MSRRQGFNALVAFTVFGAIYGVVTAQSEFDANARLTSSAPQQTVAALWAIMDLLVVLIGVGVAVVLAVAWHGLKPEVVSPPQ